MAFFGPAFLSDSNMESDKIYKPWDLRVYMISNPPRIEDSDNLAGVPGKLFRLPGNMFPPFDFRVVDLWDICQDGFVLNGKI